MHSQQTQSPPASRQPVTHPLVFVISAFLIGLGLGDAGFIGNIPVILAGGTCGVITFLFLESINRKEQTIVQDQALQEAEKQMSVRLNRHVRLGQPSRPPQHLQAPHYGKSLIRSPLSLKRTSR
ncbi:hypothetical protein [Lacunimicrobium album]